MQISAVRQAMATAIAAGVDSDIGLTAYWYVPDNVSVPCFFIKPDAIKFDVTYGRGLDEMTFTITIYVSRADDIAAQERLDAFMSGGAGSFKAALEAARNTGTGGLYAADVCDDLRVESGTAYQWYVHGDDSSKYLGGQLTVRVYGSGD